jgi:hypothetical protein
MTKEPIDLAIHLNTTLDLWAKGGDTALVMDLLLMTDTPASALPNIAATYDISPRDLRAAYCAARYDRQQRARFRNATG